MPLSLYRRLDLNKLTPIEISFQMADKSTTIPIGICEDVPVVVANVTILTDFVILDIPEDDSMSIILGRPFLNTTGDVIDCNKGNVTFHEAWYSWYSDLWYSTLKSIFSKHGGNFSFRYLSLISNNIFHILSIRRHFKHISQTHTQKDRLIISEKRSKSSSSFFLDGFGGKGMGF